MDARTVLRERPLFRLILALICFSLLVGGCNRQQEPLKIGLAINLSGRGGAAGEHIRDGALLAVEEINQQGGVNGRPLQLLVRDDRNTDDGVLLADESLIKEGVIAVIGHSLSANTVQAYPYVTSRDTLLITAYTATTKLSGRDDLFFRTAIDCNLYGRKTAALLTRKGITSVAFLLDMTNPDFVLDYVDKVRKSYAGRVATVRFQPDGNVDWNRVTADLLASAPEAIILLTEASMTAVATQRLRDLPFRGPLIGTTWTQTPELLRIAGPAAEGLRIVSFIDPENHRPGYLKFSENLQARFNRQGNARSARAYEMVYILADGLRRCGTISPSDIKAALLAGKYGSILGPLQFDRFGDVIRPVYEISVTQGRFVNLGEI